jgi:hypothetical protein
VGARVLNSDGGLRSNCTDQLQIVRLKGSKWVESIGVQRAVNPCVGD